MWLSQVVPSCCHYAVGMNIARLVLALLALAPLGSATRKCTLASLALRYEEWPIDLEPPFQSYIFAYTVILDFSMDTFALDARADVGCVVDGVPKAPTKVQIGGSTDLIIYAKHPGTGAKQAYTITATRLLGSETELQYLSVKGGELSPVFDPTIRTYSVRLDRNMDVARVVYILRDNEQRIRSSAQKEHPTGHVPQKTGNNGGRNTSSGGNGTKSSKNGNSDNADHSKDRRLREVNVADSSSIYLSQTGRRLAASGEIQFRSAYVSFMLDAGFSRIVQLTVQCADATQANIGTYNLELSRPGCIPERPFFDPIKGHCVNFCSSGFYRNMETNRCSQCNENCKVCTGLLECRMCVPDTADFSYVIQPDGHCLEIENHLFKRYQWWCVGLATLLVFLVFCGCAGLCQLCCSTGGGGSKTKSSVVTYDSDSDESPTQRRFPRGKLGRY